MLPNITLDCYRALTLNAFQNPRNLVLKSYCFRIPSAAKMQKSLEVSAYLAWINCWLTTPSAGMRNYDDFLTVEEMTRAFKDKTRFLQTDKLRHIVVSFRHRLAAKELLLGGKVPPTCDETNIVLHRYDPRTGCECSGLYPVPSDASAESVLNDSGCLAAKRMTEVAKMVIDKEDEWNPCDLFTSKSLLDAIEELILSNKDEEPSPPTCQGPITLDDVEAPDRRPNPDCDTELSVFHQLYPTNEQIKILTDAKYFFAMACGGGLCDDGMAKAVAEAANNILIADYCEAADEKSMRILQQVGAAANAFLKLCTLAGIMTDWQFNNNLAVNIQFCVLGYYRDCSRARRPNGIYGSRVTELLTHRYIDLAIYVGVVNASMGIGEEITKKQYELLAEACVYVNDLADFRSDAKRKLRENVMLRGIRGNLCRYLDGSISSCLQRTVDAVKSSPVNALVVMGICNWMLMASQHKVYEIVHGVKERKDFPSCEYSSSSDGKYEQLFVALEPYGTLEACGPDVAKRRMEMDLLYHSCRSTSTASAAWLADSTRCLLNPTNLRKIIDVVHFPWRGDAGDVEYCP